MTVDAKKAFDKVDHCMMFKILRKLPISPQTLNVIRAIYNKPTATIEINGQQIANIPYTRGIRQGCPLSMTLYAISADPMARRINNNNSIRGIRIRGMYHKIDQFADDVTLYLSDIDSITQVLREYSSLYQATGQEINTEKTEILPMNPKSHQLLKDSRHAHFAKTKIKILGIHYGEDANGINHDNLIKEVRKQAANIKSKKLSWIGKIQAIKAYIMTKITYIYYNIQITEQRRKELERIIYNILWSPENLEQKSRITLIRPKQHGGIGFPDVASTIHAKNAKRIQEIESITTPSEIWHAEAIHNMGTRVRSINNNLYNNLYTHRYAPSRDWKKEIDSYDSLRGENTQTWKLTQKEIYVALIRTKTQHDDQETPNWKQIWLYEEAIKHQISNNQRVISYRINTEAYFSGARKNQSGWAKRKDQVLKNDCKFCRKNHDTMYHIFNACPIYKKIFYIVRADIEDVIGNNINVSIEEIYRNIYTGPHKKTIITTFMNMKTEIWIWKMTLDKKNEYAEDANTEIENIRRRLLSKTRRQQNRS